MNNQQAGIVLRNISPAQIFARPTADDLWLGPARQSVLSQLSPAAAARVLIGPRSSGRSTLLRHLGQASADPGPTLRVAGPQGNASSVLEALLSSAGLTSESLDADEMREVLAAFVNECLRLDLRVVIEVDDADRFGAEAWQEIEDLIPSAGDAGPSAELLLGFERLDAASSPAADYVHGLKAPALGMISWLTPVEVGDYLGWRFGRFGLAGINTRSATRLIARCTGGRFAAIDHICQMALLVLRNEGGSVINVDVACEAMHLLRRSHEARETKGPAPEHTQSALKAAG